ncbi:MAG: hypothetical protein MUE96_00950 [Bacteroidia bacterium]|jgi:hypothetical protein|nr:hypothetical protein [Bacteroidia bacterium]
MEGVNEEKDLLQSVDELQSDLRGYAEVKLELLKADAAEKLAKGAGMLFTILLIGLLFVLVVLFGSLMAAFLIGGYVQNNAVGFGAVACFYALLFVFFFIFKRQFILTPVSNWVVALLYEEEDENGKN